MHDQKFKLFDMIYYFSFSMRFEYRALIIDFSMNFTLERLELRPYEYYVTPIWYLKLKPLFCQAVGAFIEIFNNAKIEA